MKPPALSPTTHTVSWLAGSGKEVLVALPATLDRREEMRELVAGQVSRTLPLFFPGEGAASWLVAGTGSNVCSLGHYGLMPSDGARRRTLFLSTVAAAAAVVVASVLLVTTRTHRVSPRALLVGSWNGVPGQYSTIQEAVNRARSGDWILVGPGDYHESGSNDPKRPAGVLIHTRDLHLRGMDRNGVVVDGTKRGSGPCSAAPSQQDLGPLDTTGIPAGRNGILVYKASGVSIENLTVCNYLNNRGGEAGNQVWWNGGQGSGKIGMGSYSGRYLTATSTYANGPDSPYATYGIYANNANGPGIIDYSYASNMGQASFYIGACPDCNVILRHAHAQYSALGYSGTNSGGNLIIEKSEFDHNKTAVSSNSQNNDDAPSPVDGRCSDGQTGPLRNSSCEIWRDNYVHDNNDPSVPGASPNGPKAVVGVGFALTGTQHVTVYDNRIVHNGAWGVLVLDLPDRESPPPVAQCRGGVRGVSGSRCYYPSYGNEVVGNSFQDNGFYGNPTNGDLALATIPHSPGNCFTGNNDLAGLTSTPRNIQLFPFSPCGLRNSGDLGTITAEAECAADVAACTGLPAATYPRPTQVVLPPAPLQPSMPDPCSSVPPNRWCTTKGAASR